MLERVRVEQLRTANCGDPTNDNTGTVNTPAGSHFSISTTNDEDEKESIAINEVRTVEVQNKQLIYKSH